MSKHDIPRRRIVAAVGTAKSTRTAALQLGFFDAHGLSERLRVEGLQVRRQTRGGAHDFTIVEDRRL